MIIKKVKHKIVEKLGGDFYTSGMIVFAQSQIKELISFEAKVIHVLYAISFNYDTIINLKVFESDESYNKNPAI